MVRAALQNGLEDRIPAVRRLNSGTVAPNNPFADLVPGGASAPAHPSVPASTFASYVTPYPNYGNVYTAPVVSKTPATPGLINDSGMANPAYAVHPTVATPTPTPAPTPAPAAPPSTPMVSPGATLATPANPVDTQSAPSAPMPSITDIIRSTPGYQFQLNQGLAAINSNAYARGLGNSGATLKALYDYGQNAADNYYQQYLNNVSGVAAGGAGAAGALAGVSQNYGNSATTTMQNTATAAEQAAAARANAAGTMANGITTGISSIFNNTGVQQGIGSMFHSSIAPPNLGPVPVNLGSPAPATLPPVDWNATLASLPGMG